MAKNEAWASGSAQSSGSSREGSIATRSKRPARGGHQAVAGRAKGRKRQKNYRRALILVAFTIFIVATAYAAILYTDNAKNYEFSGQASQYYVGGEYKVPAGATMRRDGDITNIHYTGIIRDAVNLPIYYKDQPVVVLPQDMAFYDPRGMEIGKLPRFTEITYDASGQLTATLRGRTRTLSLGFLFDGTDTYLFLEPTTIYFNDYSLPQGAMSFAEAVYNGQVMLYNKETGEFVTEPPRGAVSARALAGDYTISLLGDYFEKADGTRTLLFTKPEMLDSMF